MDRTLLVEESVALVEQWLSAAKAGETAADRSATGPLQELIEDPLGVAFTMQFVDRVVRPDDNRVAAGQLRSLLAESAIPTFLGRIDRWLLQIGGLVALVLPPIVMPLARKRVRSIVGHLVLDATPSALLDHLGKQKEAGFDQNVNLLGEAVLGKREATNRVQAILELIDNPRVDYVSVKLSAVVPQLNYWDWTGSLSRSCSVIRRILSAATHATPETFVNFDMEEYHDLELTVEAFKMVMSEPKFAGVEAGIVLQAYLPDSFEALKDVVAWATDRKARGGAGIKVRLVKGANLAMESVEAEERGWALAPFNSKAGSDANYKRLIDWVCNPHHTEAVRIGIASHNLFDVAWAHLLSEERGVAERVEFEMLQGMAPSQGRIVREQTDGLLLYTPVVRPDDFEVAISYLFRRLEENSAEGNFMRSLFSLTPGGEAFTSEAEKFAVAVAARADAVAGSNRSQIRPSVGAYSRADRFENEPDSDPAQPAVRAWAEVVTAKPFSEVGVEVTDSLEQIDHVLNRARRSDWSQTGVEKRRSLLLSAASELARKRGDLISCMMHEAKKTFAQADAEVSEAVDFARYYGDQALRLSAVSQARFSPFGTVVVSPPWNFPVAIPAGGALAALAAGNAVVLKPAPETPRCAELVAEACWSAGIPRDALQFVRTPDNEVGKRLVVGADAVILTGGYETAQLFQSWKPDMRLFAETSGKNALVVTPNADLDMAASDLAYSAFGHSGQKCSAASLAILVGDVYDNPRFRRQLLDAAESLELGDATELPTMMGPTVSEPSERLHRGLTELAPGEEWLLKPRRVRTASGDDLWSPGIRLGVEAGSWFHATECFGPVLGLMRAKDLGEAISIQNSSRFGLTGGIHTLDPAEADRWVEAVEVGNAYVNRPTTGAIVQRQPFGGWKQSSFGPGAKAGGPNYLAQLGVWHPTSDLDIEVAKRSDEVWFNTQFSAEHDPTALWSESNVFRYRPLDAVGLWVGPDSEAVEVARVRSIAGRLGVELLEGSPASGPMVETVLRFSRLTRVRVLGSVPAELWAAAAETGVDIADAPVTNDGYLEARHFVREQSVSRTLHRFGNVIS